eukprot:6581901-Prymnesium_polylepis.1
MVGASVQLNTWRFIGGRHPGTRRSTPSAASAALEKAHFGLSLSRYAHGDINRSRKARRLASRVAWRT